jgi:hypothetical protein
VKLFKNHPEARERVRKALGTAVHRGPSVATVDGNVRGAVTNDVHVPFHDRDALRLAAKVLEAWKPDVHIMAGDMMDFYTVSDYDKNPARAIRLQDEINTWHCEVVAPLSAAVGKRCRQIYLPGNHENRLLRHLWRHPALFGVRANCPIYLSLVTTASNMRKAQLISPASWKSLTEPKSAENQEQAPGQNCTTDITVSPP